MPLEPTSPKTTQPSAKKLREKKQKRTTAEKLNKNLDAFPDKIDVRDWFYQPNLRPLPDQVINCDLVPCILDQGQEGACTGFALAAVINYHLVRNGRFAAAQIGGKEGVSPRMLYEMARRYDEWPGESYEGSSARGTMKGWAAHGVVKRWMWDDELTGYKHLDETRAREALKTPAGAYYRVMHREIRDMHAALNETGILFATLLIHKGWEDPNDIVTHYKYTRGNKEVNVALPVIQKAEEADGGHAVAIVGYTKDGFIIQNSWGTGWGYNGFALLPYEDWMMHASDCWVVQLGVPIEVNLPQGGNGETADAGIQRASNVIPLQDIRPFIINIGNNGFLSDTGEYWTSDEDIDRLFKSIDAKAQDNGWAKRRILLYLHGGLNSEREAARRVIAFKEVCLKNEIYPVHIMWETDFWTSLKDQVFDTFNGEDKASAAWLSQLREAVLELKDRTIELTTAKLGTMLWQEMKENAELASSTKPASNGKKRAIVTVAEKGLAAYNGLRPGEKKKWEIHIVAHSAGSIFLAYALETLLRIGIPVRSVQLMAPAISVELFKRKMLPLIQKNKDLNPTLYVLSDKGERDDDVGPYGKSLLYLVSNAFEYRRETPLLGMEKFINMDNPELRKDEIDKDIYQLLKKDLNGWPRLVIAGKAPARKVIGPDICRASSHSAFDNDSFTLNSVLYRILGEEPKRKFEARDLQY